MTNLHQEGASHYFYWWHWGREAFPSAPREYRTPWFRLPSPQNQASAEIQCIPGRASPLVRHRGRPLRLIPEPFAPMMKAGTHHILGF